jgi:hypothetical protein
MTKILSGNAKLILNLRQPAAQTQHAPTGAPEPVSA